MKITVKGEGIILAINDYDYSDDYYELPFIIKGVVVLADGEDITKKKGKYLTSRYVHDLVAKDGATITSASICDYSKDFVAEFDIPVEDFDPKKLQLIKSDYEFAGMPYGILASTVVYDGKEYDTDSELLDRLRRSFSPTDVY